MAEINDGMFGVLGNLNNGGRTNALNQFLTDVGDDRIGEDGIDNNNGGGGVRITQSNYVLNIKSNIRDAVVLIDGEISNRKTPSQLTISKQQLIQSGDKTITLSKNGYVSNERYVISLNTNGNTLTPNLAYDSGYGNLSKSDISIRYYVNDIEQPYIQTTNSLKELSFTLSERAIEITETKNYNIQFLISGKGNPVSVVKNSTINATFFPTIGASSYTDISGTKYRISSSDISLYRITKITYNKLPDVLGPTVFVAADGESLEVDILLNSSYQISIETEEIQPELPALNPKIELVTGGARTYNINSEVGVPLMFKKNNDVNAITIIVGDDIIEFDDLDKGDLCGITIPHDVFENIGKYNIKIFPFSLENYEQQVRPVQPAEKVETKRVETKFNVKEEVKLPPIDVNDKYNPYTLKGSGGGGGRGTREVLTREFGDNIEETNPFSNRGDFTERELDNRNFR